MVIERTTANEHVFHRSTVQEKAVHEYLIATYGDDFFSLDDFLNMEIGSDGTVYIGWVQIRTGIEY